MKSMDVLLMSKFHTENCHLQKYRYGKDLFIETSRVISISNDTDIILIYIDIPSL